MKRASLGRMIWALQPELGWLVVPAKVRESLSVVAVVVVVVLWRWIGWECSATGVLVYFYTLSVI